MKHVLENWKECGFDKQPFIVKCLDTGFYLTKSVCHLGYITGYRTVRAAKSAIRVENSVKGKTPRFKWIKELEQE